MKQVFLFIIVLTLSLSARAASRDTIPVFFATGKSVLTEGIENGLVNYIYKDVLRNGQKLQIVGYADYVGSGRSNDALSKARAATVKRFLMGYGFEEKDITICIGKGEIAREGVSGNEGFARDRRVDIVLDPQPAPAPETPAVALPPPPIPKPVRTAKPVVTTKPADLPDLATMKPNETIRLERLYFYPGRHIIRPESVNELYRLEHILEGHPALKIGIEGHICCTDPQQGDALDVDTHEIALSLNRAKEVYLFLVKKGIEEDRLTYKGFGATRKLVEEHTEDDANQNRRVEIRVLEN